MAEIKEQRWLCGCQIVDGELVRKCTNVKPAGELSAGQVAALPPYSAKCYRLAQEQQIVEAASAPAQPAQPAQLNAAGDANPTAVAPADTAVEPAGEQAPAASD